MNSNTNLSADKIPTVTFLGAAHSVSGSIHLIETQRNRFLLDCGLFRGPREEARMRNANFAFEPQSIDAIFLSHAHMDHCGNIPNLVRQGFRGPIYCTHATRDLMEVMLLDSARIHEREIAEPRHRSARDVQSSLFEIEDVVKSIELCVAVDYLDPIEVNQDVQIEFIDSGHILGSAIIVIKLNQAGQEYTITFTGDLGRRGVPYVAQPSLVPASDLIICESTYGGKQHDSLETMAEKMSGFVTQTYERGGKVLVPAFSLGRTHLVLHYLRQWMSEGRMPRMPIYIDSPLAMRLDEIFDRYRNSLATQADAVDCRWLETEDEAWLCTTQKEPCIILASGGMCEGGRIVQHLKQHIDDPRCTIVLVSYQAADSMGAKLLSRAPTVRLHGSNWNKWIEVAEVKGFSGHADRDDFQHLLQGAVEKTGKIRLVHGEPQQMQALATQLREMGFADVAAPKRKERVAI